MKNNIILGAVLFTLSVSVQANDITDECQKNIDRVGCGLLIAYCEVLACWSNERKTTEQACNRLLDLHKELIGIDMDICIDAEAVEGEFQM